MATDLFGAKQCDHRDKISRNADQHEEDATDGGETQQPPWIIDEEDHGSRILQHLLNRVTTVVVPSFVAPPVFQHLRKAKLLPTSTNVVSGP